MIIFEKEKFLNEIKEHGVSATDPMAKQKIQFLIEDYLLNTSYRKGAVIDKIKECAADYFAGLPDAIISKELANIYDFAKSQIKLNKTKDNHENKVITLYKSEMEILKQLDNDRLQRLAFASLILHKYCGQFFVGGSERYYPTVKSCDADIYRLAGLDKLSGKQKNELWQQLSELGLVKHFIKTNNAFKFNPKWNAFNTFMVCFNADLKDDKDNEEVYARVTNYDDVMLFLRYYIGDSQLMLCDDCGCPIVRTSNAKCLCSNCASSRKRLNDKNRYHTKTAFA